ncbi:MAG: hypothetical protein AABW47_00050 [Nanoarchaeota archaeon]
MVNYEYRDLVHELLAGQDLIRECSETGEEVDFSKLIRTTRAINFYRTHKEKYTLEQRTGITLLIQGINEFYYVPSAEEVA